MGRQDCRVFCALKNLFAKGQVVRDLIFQPQAAASREEKVPVLIVDHDGDYVAP